MTERRVQLPQLPDTADAPSPDVETVLAQHVRLTAMDQPFACSCEPGTSDASQSFSDHLAAALRGAGLPEPSGEWRVEYGYRPDGSVIQRRVTEWQEATP
jgi:hypothetical protein